MNTWLPLNTPSSSDSSSQSQPERLPSRVPPTPEWHNITLTPYKAKARLEYLHAIRARRQVIYQGTIGHLMTVNKQLQDLQRREDESLRMLDEFHELLGIWPQGNQTSQNSSSTSTGQNSHRMPRSDAPTATKRGESSDTSTASRLSTLKSNLVSSNGDPCLVELVEVLEDLSHNTTSRFIYGTAAPEPSIAPSSDSEQIGSEQASTSSEETGSEQADSDSEETGSEKDCSTDGAEEDLMSFPVNREESMPLTAECNNSTYETGDEGDDSSSSYFSDDDEDDDGHWDYNDQADESDEHYWASREANAFEQEQAQIRYEQEQVAQDEYDEYDEEDDSSAGEGPSEPKPAPVDLDFAKQRLPPHIFKLMCERGLL